MTQPPYGYLPVPPLPASPDPRRAAAHPHPEPRPYDEMLRTWTFAWWKALIGVLGLLAGVVVVAPILLLPVLAAAVAIEGPRDFGHAFADALTAKTVTPAAMLYINLALASAVPVSWAVVRLVHNLRPRWLASVRPGIRWRLLFASVGLAVATVVVSTVIGALLPGDTGEPTGHPHHLTGKIIAIGLVILVTTPLQAAGEEYAFRGYLLQAVGSVFGAVADRGGVRRPAADVVVQGVAIVVPAILFAIAHGTQNWPLFLDRFAFGLAAGYVAIRVGGLEVGIAMHAVNNLVAFGIPLLFSNIDSALQVTHVSWWQLPLSLVQNGLFVVLALWLARRLGVQTRTAPPVLETPTPYR